MLPRAMIFPEQEEGAWQSGNSWLPGDLPSGACAPADPVLTLLSLILLLPRTHWACFLTLSFPPPASL